MQVEQVVEGYFAAMRARDVAAVTSLYAQDATFILPDGREFNGVEAISAMHQGVFSASAPVPTAGAMILADNAAAIEIEARLPDGSSRHTTNHFYLNSDGKIARLNVYIKAAM
ncbi:MAG: SgcJ/EcaC family oxidoreductase [Novosphingobium sp.]|nr:SgcJ/EcaC family oxidoreductase [Novosphingobium sp.]